MMNTYHENSVEDSPEPFPTVFFGHGSPMNALQDNAYSAAWGRFGRRVPKPRAVLAVSAHWYLPGTALTVSTSPRTIHDFGGFPQALYEVRYPAPGDPDLAGRVRDLLSPVEVEFDDSWGLDHGTWSVLKHVYPRADVPVVQLRIDSSRPAAFHYEIGQALAPLRSEGIMILGSGNLVHNLKRYDWEGNSGRVYDWAGRFEQRARELILEERHADLVDYRNLGRDAALSIPTPEHYLPLLYVLGGKLPGDRVSFPVEGIEGGSISMLAVELSQP
jgi:4,5-DOPA dioxygenase extradiol